MNMESKSKPVGNHAILSPKRRPSCVFLAVLIGLAASTLSNAVGVGVTKSSSNQSDASARAFVFTRVKDDGGRIVVFTVGNRLLSVDRTHSPQYVQVWSHLPPNIVTEAQLAPVKEKYRELSNFAARFRQAKPLLQPHIDAFEETIQSYQSGMVRYNGRWITRKSYAEAQKKIQKEKADKALADRKKAEDRRRKAEDRRRKAIARRNRELTKLEKELADLENKLEQLEAVDASIANAAGRPREFIVSRKLDPKKFPGLSLPGEEIYQIEIGGRVPGILVTREIAFTSEGRAFMWMLRRPDTVSVTMDSGFNKMIPIYEESPSEAVDAYKLHFDAKSKCAASIRKAKSAIANLREITH
jgi:hypothetical protein